MVSEVRSLQEKVSNLEIARICDSPFSDYNIICQDAHERSLKAINRMVFNIPSVANSEAIAILVNNLFRNLAIQCFYISVKWVGRSGSRPHSIVVEFNSPSDVHTVLKSKRKMRNFECWSKVWIHEAFTIMQHKQLLGLRSELKRLHDNGDDDWIIRYSNGFPQLAKKSFNNSTLANRKTE